MILTLLHYLFFHFIPAKSKINTKQRFIQIARDQKSLIQFIQLTQEEGDKALK